MQYLIFTLEIIVIVFYVDVVHGTSNTKIIQMDNQKYSSYYSIDSVNNTILTLNKIPEYLKINIWLSSKIQFEVLKYFPNMQMMNEVYNDRLIDNGIFKKNFLNYMEELQAKYISGNIDEEEFKKQFLSPSF